MATHYELYYSDGGHGGPYFTFASAYAACLHRLNEHTTCIEIRSTTSTQPVGGFAPDHPASFYITRFSTIH